MFRRAVQRRFDARIYPLVPACFQKFCGKLPLHHDLSAIERNAAAASVIEVTVVPDGFHQFRERLLFAPEFYCAQRAYPGAFQAVRTFIRHTYGLENSVFVKFDRRRVSDRAHACTLPAFMAGNAFFRINAEALTRFKSFRIRTPQAPQRASGEEDRRSYSGPVMNRIVLNITDQRARLSG